MSPMRHPISPRLPLLLTLVLLCATEAPAETRYVAPNGTPGGDGSRTAPWDIESTLAGQRGVKPGDTVHLLAGTYRRRPKEQFEVKLAGAENQPLRVRAAPGERATIDGGLLVLEGSTHLWIQDLEILVSEPQPEKPVGPGS